MQALDLQEVRADATPQMEVRMAHARSEKEIVLRLLESGRPVSMMGLVAEAHRRYGISPDDVRTATWSLVAEGAIELTPDQRFRVPSSGGRVPA